MRHVACKIFLVLLLCATAWCQLPSSLCDQVAGALEDCAFTVERNEDLAVVAQHGMIASANAASSFAAEASVGAAESPGGAAESRGAAEKSRGAAESSRDAADSFVTASRRSRHENFHWGRALFESFTFLAIEQAYVVHDDYRWVVGENGVPFSHYWSDYKQSLSTWAHSGWDDGDAFLYSYVGHPIQGALTEYIQIQNDPQGRELEFSNTKAYWWSRFKAFWWNAAYSTQWNIGPLSEMTVEKYGTVNTFRHAWTHRGTYPCYEHCLTGVGEVDLVTTPVGGALWVLTEDLLDKKINRRVEGVTRNLFLIDLMRCSLNPIRGGANLLHGKRPWYRASRDARALYFAKHAPTGFAVESNEK